MKLSTIAKTSLALGILTTGVMTTYAQSANAAQTSVQNNISVEELKTYYTKTPFELRNVKGERDGNKVNVIYRDILTEVDLLGNDKDRVSEELLKSKIDVFVVGEGTSRQAPTHSIGGITKPNSKNYTDYVAKPQLDIIKEHGQFKSIIGDGPHYIDKEEISLKELDFKLRKKLIDKKLLYTDGKKNGKIVVKMNSGKENDKYTFELDKKLQDHRMGDVIDSRKIEKITVEL